MVCATARAINARERRTALPFLLVFTDPARLSDPFAVRARFPRGVGIVYRHFGAPDRADVAARLARRCRRAGLKLLIGADPELARKVRADGVHLPERMGACAARLKAQRPGWIVTVARHGRKSVDAADAHILSPVLPSRSASAAKPLGVRQGALIARRARRPVFALGGVNGRTAGLLRRRGFCGLALVDGVRT